MGEGEVKDKTRAPRTSRSGWVHFGIAVFLLAGSAAGFQYTVETLKWVTQKESVPWPQWVVVDPEILRWENLPEQLGDRFFLAEDGEFGGEPDGLADGELLLEPDVLDSLGIASSWDKARAKDRRSNWHVVRIYRDAKRPPGDPLRYWRLGVYYYTGSLDLVPHVPERCLVAGGATLEDSKEIKFSILHAKKPWNDPVPFRRTRYKVADALKLHSSQYVQYYTFSLNGEPESSWEKVRLHLAKPWVKYCYFSKLQFAPLFPVDDLEEADQAAKELMNYFLPVILRALPMPSDIEALKAAEEGGE